MNLLCFILVLVELCYGFAQTYNNSDEAKYRQVSQIFSDRVQSWVEETLGFNPVNISLFGLEAFIYSSKISMKQGIMTTIGISGFLFSIWSVYVLRRLWIWHYHYP